MIKKLFIYILIFIPFSFTSCMTYKNVDLTLIEKEITSTINTENFSKGSLKELRRFFNINSDDILDFLIYTPAYTMDVNEILILKLKDNSNIDAIKDAIDARVESQIQTFGSYGPTQCALLEDYIVKSKGNYIFYSVSPDNEKIYEIFKESIK